MSTADSWIHNFTVTDTRRHEEGYTVYKITSVVFPAAVPEALTHVTVWKRFNEVKKLLKYVRNRHSTLGLRGEVPDIRNNGYFQRFHPDTISKRKLFILELLDFISQHPVLYKSHIFQLFFEDGDHLEAIDVNSIHRAANLVETTRSVAAIDAKIAGDAFKIKQNENGQTIDAPLEQPKKTARTSGESGEDFKYTTHDNMEYFYEAASELSYGGRAEENNHLKEAFERYKRGVDILLRGSKHDFSKSNKIKVKKYATEYMSRAEAVLKKLESRSCENQIINRNNFAFGCQRSLHELAKIKVMQIIGSVLQVQDISNNQIYIMKVVQKDLNEDDLYYPTNIPYMVNLVAYYTSDTSIFLLLEYASGRRLKDYIHSYRMKGIETKEDADVIALDPIEENTGPSSTNEGPADSSIDCSQQAAEDIPKSTSLHTVISRPPHHQLKLTSSATNCQSSRLHKTTVKSLNSIEVALPEMTLKRWFSEIIEALHNLHMENIYCFDLNPNNILLGSKGEILLSYFYKTLHHTSLNYCKWDATLSALTLPSYIAPERPLNAKSDWWSAGIIFFELFTGHSFESCHPSGTSFYYEIQYPDGIDVHEDLNTLLLGMIEPDPDIRLSLAEIKAHSYFSDIEWRI